MTRISIPSCVCLELEVAGNDSNPGDDSNKKSLVWPSIME